MKKLLVTITIAMGSWVLPGCNFGCNEIGWGCLRAGERMVTEEECKGNIDCREVKAPEGACHGGTGGTVYCLLESAE